MLVWSVFYGNLALSQGPTTHFSELAKGLTNDGVTVIGYAPAIGKYSGPNTNFKIKYTPTLNLPFIRVVVYDFLLMLRLLVTFPKPDILYVRVAYFSFFAPLVAKLFGIKLVLEINGFVVDDIASKEWTGPLAWISINCEKFLHTIADASIIVTETIYNAIHETFGISKSKLHHIKNGVNVDHFKPMDKVVCKQALGFDPATEYIGYVGCFTDWDGIEHIVRALPRILEKREQVKVLLVGDGDHRPFVEAEVAQLGLQDKVIFTGYVAYRDLPKYLNCFSVAVAPYGGGKDVETRNNKGLSSLKCLEYTGTGLPTVVADIPGMDYIRDKSGFIIPQGDEIALAARVLEILENPALVQKFGEYGRDYTVKNCSWQAVADRTKIIFEGLLA